MGLIWAAVGLLAAPVLAGDPVFDRGNPEVVTGSTGYARSAGRLAAFPEGAPRRRTCRWEWNLNQR